MFLCNECNKVPTLVATYNDSEDNFNLYFCKCCGNTIKRVGEKVLQISKDDVFSVEKATVKELFR